MTSEHEPRIIYLGPDDHGPLMRIIVVCSCGAAISDRAFDARRPEDPDRSEAIAHEDGAFWLAHLDAVGA